MSANIMDGKAVARNIREGLKEEVEGLKKKGIHPGLAVVLVGENPASMVYVKNKGEACRSAGIYSEEHKLPAETKEADLLGLINQLNKDPRIHGILVQLPLPAHINKDRILASVSPEKDVDGFHEINMGRLLIGQEGLVPCTPLGIMQLLEHYHIPVEGRFAVVVGRSNIVGKPVAMMLLQRNATVTICHTRTKNMGEVCRMADILIAAAGRPGMITADMIREGAVVIDVGINRLDTGKLAGDVDFESASKKAGWITPVPGGVGPMTIAMLLYNTVKAAKMSVGSKV
ncbi:MAG TPA: bifunctional methylenetetrahydrofolate dehydrogenase/methenyltetrahydrofolate cyclohydrolase FolD [Nitrospirota bacterium]|nr:bifunctional methylenetetrahydrofolate dehydrogenase/methenyltetrahydrofolate cyclohydrolase FolD [Nitrospirota bacterium]